MTFGENYFFIKRHVRMFMTSNIMSMNQHPTDHFIGRIIIGGKNNHSTGG